MSYNTCVDKNGIKFSVGELDVIEHVFANYRDLINERDGVKFDAPDWGGMDKEMIAMLNPEFVDQIQHNLHYRIFVSRILDFASYFDIQAVRDGYDD